MKKIGILISFCLLFLSCSEDNDLERNKVSFSLNFTHNWEGTTVTNADFNDIKFTNENGQQLSIERLRYLVSKVTFYNQNQETIVTTDYNLVDVTNNENLLFTLSDKIPAGTYSKVIFTFGFDETDNIDGVYTDLNTASFDVPPMLNGGYHYMQFDGKYINANNEETGFNFHAISAVDTIENKTEDTSFEVNLGEITINNETTVEVQADLSEWFKNPNTWDLNTLFESLMGNFEAQKQISANGKAVFSVQDSEN